MFDNSDLTEFSDIELMAELDRREKLRQVPWPRRTTVSYEASDLDEIADFLMHNCGFSVDSKEYNKAERSLANIELEVDVNSDGSTKIVGAVVVDSVEDAKAGVLTYVDADGVRKTAE